MAVPPLRGDWPGKFGAGAAYIGWFQKTKSNMLKGSNSIYFGNQFTLLRMRKTISFLMPWNLQRIVETIGFGALSFWCLDSWGRKWTAIWCSLWTDRNLTQFTSIYFRDGGPYSISPWTSICWVTNSCSGRLPSFSETMCYAAPPPLPGETQTPHAWPRVETGFQYIPIFSFIPTIWCGYVWRLEIFWHFVN